MGRHREEDAFVALLSVAKEPGDAFAVESALQVRASGRPMAQLLGTFVHIPALVGVGAGLEARVAVAAEGADQVRAVRVSATEVFCLQALVNVHTASLGRVAREPGLALALEATDGVGANCVLLGTGRCVAQLRTFVHI